MANIYGVHHVGLLVSALEQALRFYGEVVGLVSNPARPDLGYPGVWLDVGGQQLHLMQLPSPDPATGRPAHGGQDRHVALAVRALDVVERALDHAGIPYTCSRSGRRALFCRDPDGNALELVEMG